MLRLELTRRQSGSLVLLLLLPAMLLVAWGHWRYLPLLPQSWLWSLGGVAELLVLAILALTMVAVQLMGMPRHVYRWLTAGLCSWLFSAVTDVMDELVRQPRWLSAFGEDILRLLGMSLVMVGLIHLIRHANQAWRAQERLVHYDELTGLGNRRHFQQWLQRYEDRGYALLLLDLDHFKAVNDGYGHDAGDKVLQRFAAVLAQRCLGWGEPLRLGGEEFAVLSSERDEARLQAYAEALRAAVAAADYTPVPRVSTSIGVALQQPGEGRDEVMRRADRALYRAKDAGRNRVVWADPA